MRTVTALMFFVIFAMSFPAYAQENDSGNTPEPAPEVLEQVAPYDDKLLRLAEVLGAIHQLRALCGADEGNKWRDVMSKIIASENPQPKRKSRLIARFNRGYRAFNESYTNCTDSALLAEERYRQEGAKLSNQITSRYER